MRRSKIDPTATTFGNGKKCTSIGNSKRTKYKNKHKRRQKKTPRGQS